MHHSTWWCLAPNQIINSFWGVSPHMQGWLSYYVREAYFPSLNYENERREWKRQLDLFCVYAFSCLDLDHQSTNCRYPELYSQWTQSFDNSWSRMFFHTKFYYPAVYEPLWKANDTHTYLSWFFSLPSVYPLVN